MTSQAQSVRVRPFFSVLDGNNPVELVNKLVAAGYDRFYVKVPKGFGTNIFSFDPFPCGYQLEWPEGSSQKRARPGTRRSQIEYLQLDISQLRDVIQDSSAALGQFGVGGLEAVVTPGQLIPVDFTYIEGFFGGLVPATAAVAERVPTTVDDDLTAPMVVKTLRRNRTDYSYALFGVGLKDIFVEEAAVANVLAAWGTANAVSPFVDEDLPRDPYGLKDSSPLVYEILCAAYRNRGLPRSKIKKSDLISRFQDLNAPFKKNPKPFSVKGAGFAANLANPLYRYEKKRPALTRPFPEARTVPSDGFFDQNFINAELKTLLYAACCWSDCKEPLLGRDSMRLVELLRSLGFRDAGQDDPVQMMLYFIVGEPVPRKWPDTEYRDNASSKK